MPAAIAGEEKYPYPASGLEKAIGYTFRNQELLLNALRHSSYSNETKKTQNASNERLEFLGDSVLSVIVSDYIYRNYASLDEGDLTKIRASVVCENSLAALAARLELGSYMYLGHGEIVTHGRNRKSIVADAFEALRPQQGFVIGRWQVFPEKEVIDQITPLERIGYRESSFRRRNGRRSGDMQIREHPLLFDGVDAVDEFSACAADRKYRLLEPENFARVGLPLLGMVTQLQARALDGPHHGILPLLQPAVFGKQGHIGGVPLQSGDTRPHLLRSHGQGRQETGQHAYRLKITHSHLHHLIKNNWINPKISRRPNSIRNVLLNLTTAGNPA